MEKCIFFYFYQEVKMKKTLLIVLFVVLATTIFAQGTNSDWRPPPFPQWFQNLSEIEREALLEIAFSSRIATVTLYPSLVRIETRKIINEYKVAWAYREDDENVFCFIIRDDNGQFVQIMISRYWLNNLR
jgi:hypothetical protein